ncbi:MAG TPA: hypothetical protein VNN18_00005 [Candidatus Xenobia bacterium]|nr:hypothetical protein [Candidatus Xenobia bacterium]
MIVIDELGKFLEFASKESERADIFFLQQLAEATASFKSPGLFLITILHQAFERYAAGLRPAVRDEWSKIQGRFEDIAFQEPPEQLLDVLAHAIAHSETALTQTMRRRARTYAGKAAELGLVPRGMSKSQFIQAVGRCAPLHPLTVMTLVRLCRKFGQNQRSLFGFLVSREPKGFSSFLEQEVSRSSLPFYGVTDLYDYIAEALGNGLAIGESATKWAEIESALDRCASASPSEIRLIKIVGMLSAIGAYGDLKPSQEIIEFGFDTKKQEVRRACETLLQRSVLVHRKHSQSLALWEGSDIDIDTRVQEAKRHIAQAISLARKLGSLWVPRPLVAKRHSFQTGTLRYFEIRFADSAEFSRALQGTTDADGLLVYCLPASRADYDQLLELAKGSLVRERADIIVAIPREIDALRNAVQELECLRWVENNTPELKGDAVARRELRARLALADERVSRDIQSLFSPGERTARNTLWFHRGIPQTISTKRSLAHFLSDICDAVYQHTPKLRNELINRRNLSSAAAAARRNLIEAMITRGAEERLGITGNPPEMSMYISVLAATQIHRRRPDGCVFGPPRTDKGLMQVWKAIEDFFAGCELQRRPISELLCLLRQPPFGLKMGVIPVLFCAAALARDTEIALYENGAFVPDLTIETFERLLRSPEKFEIRRYRIIGIRKEVFRQFAGLLGASKHAKTHNLVSIVRPLYRFFNRLPPYSQQTKTVSETTRAVREALVSAREPDVLLFEDLPRACGLEPFLARRTNIDRAAGFFRSLKSALIELQRAYDDLLAELQESLFRAFNTTGPKSRELVRLRAQAIWEHSVDPRLRAFVHHLCDEQLDNVAWTEAVGTLVVGKTPRMWSDMDRARYDVNLIELVRSFRHIETLVFEITRQLHLGKAPAEVLRIGITDRHSKEREAVVVVESDDQDKLAEAVIEVEECLKRQGVVGNPELALAALATVSRRFLAELETPSEPVRELKGEKVRHE